MLILYIKKIETYVQKIYLKTKTTTKPNQKPQNANDKVIIEENDYIFTSPTLLKNYILYTIYYYIFQKVTAFIIPNKLLLPIYLQVGNK